MTATVAQRQVSNLEVFLPFLSCECIKDLERCLRLPLYGGRGHIFGLKVSDKIGHTEIMRDKVFQLFHNYQFGTLSILSSVTYVYIAGISPFRMYCRKEDHHLRFQGVLSHRISKRVALMISMNGVTHDMSSPHVPPGEMPIFLKVYVIPPQLPYSLYIRSCVLHKYIQMSWSMCGMRCCRSAVSTSRCR